MSWKTAFAACALMLVAMISAPATAQSGSVDSEFCNRTNISDVAARLTREWGERYSQPQIEQVAAPGMLTARGVVVSSSSTEVICRITFTNLITDTLPPRRLALSDVDFRYAEPGGQPQLFAITLPMTGMDERAAIRAIWERLTVNDVTLRSRLETLAETNPQMATLVAEIIGRPAEAEGIAWEPEKFCELLNDANLPPSIVAWAESSGATRDTGLTLTETPRWLPATNWRVEGLQVVSSIPFQQVICSANVFYSANRFGGNSVPMEIRGLSYKVWGNGDGSQIYVEPHRWPNAEGWRVADNDFNQAWVVNGETFRHAWDERRRAADASGAPRNALEALGREQTAANAATEAYLSEQGVDVDAIRRAEAEETSRNAEPCRRNGGTWGRPTDQYGNQGRLGCYYPNGDR